VAVEILRLLVVLFGAGIGYQVARALGADEHEQVLGTFSGLWLGAIVGALGGYVLGGVLARLTLRTIDRGEGPSRASPPSRRSRAVSVPSSPRSLRPRSPGRCSSSARR